MSKKIRTRFAPSPTGFLHIGGARTALFNYYFSKNMGGEFLLRIEDTDKARSTAAATQAILDGLAWLGVSHDGDIVYQSQNAKAHQDIAYALLAAGKAYKCYASPEELESLRDKARESGHAFRSPYRDSAQKQDPEKGQENDRPYTIRFKVPDGQTTLDDAVQGQITWQNSAFDDLVLLRADGTPTYMLAVIVDDHNMGITHVIRGDDHLINAGRQSQIFAAMGWETPQWAHVPLIHGPDGKKLSKRHGALGVEAYRDMGYLPSGLRNYLVKLGWSQGDQEIFLGDDDISGVFSLGGINSAPARLDFDKMDYINGQHLNTISTSQCLDFAAPFIESKIGRTPSIAEQTRIEAAMQSLQSRSKTLKDIAVQAEYLLLTRPIELTGKPAKALNKAGAINWVKTLTLALKSLEDTQWKTDILQQFLQDFVEQHEIGFGKIGQPVRAALTGGYPSPDLSQVLAFLGKDEALARLNDAVNDNIGNDI